MGSLHLSVLLKLEERWEGAVGWKVDKSSKLAPREANTKKAEFLFNFF